MMEKGKKVAVVELSLNRVLPSGTMDDAVAAAVDSFHERGHLHIF